MTHQIYTFSFLPDWMKLTNEISLIDRFDASWSTIEKRERQALKQLKSIATVRSVGASTRIEGSTMSDDEVEVLIENLKISKLEERDQQEVAGYFETLELIGESYKNIEITESNLMHLHNVLMRYSEKDAWHKGGYKGHANVVESKRPDGTTKIVFKTTGPGYPTADAMAQLMKWYRSDMQPHVLIKAAIFVYDFLSIHPFQDGNGRLSRLLGTLLLMKQGYTWIQYVSFEHEIENRKSEYYQVLMQCQRGRPGEDVYPWVLFFLDCLKNIQQQLEQKMEVQTRNGKLPIREKAIYSFIENHPGSKSGEIAEKLNIPLPTVKRILIDMVNSKMILKTGAGAGTNYVIEGSASIRKNLVMRFNSTERKKEFTLSNTSACIIIKEILIRPLFEWQHPNDWGTKLLDDNMTLQVQCFTRSGIQVTAAPIAILPSLYHKEPTVIVDQPIDVVDWAYQKIPLKKDYPMAISIDLATTAPQMKFDIMVVYDEG